MVHKFLIAHCILLGYNIFMPRYSISVIEEARHLRSLGQTYGEIRQSLKLNIPKSTLSEWCKNTKLPKNYSERIAKLNILNLHKGRSIAHEINKIKREEYLDQIDKINLPISVNIDNKMTSKIALAMLCLGEASKSGNGSSFYFGNSNPKIITLFLELMKRCFDFKPEKVRCTVQCRADQNILVLEEFWMEITKIPKSQFYKTQVDPRTIGRVTKKLDYKGVLRVDYFDSKVRHELESLANLVYNRLVIDGPVA